jgi:RNA polymerase sigma-70 factor (ECF subfamily)
MSESDSALVRRTLGGEPAAFDELTARHRPGLVRFLALQIGDVDEAESLAQEALTRAFANLAHFQRDLHFGAWLRGIALNLSRNYLRDRARHAEPLAPERLGEAPAREGRRQGVLSGILRREMGEQTAEAIQLLPIPLREAFVLRFVDEMDYAEMSKITGAAEGTLRVRAHRARTLLRDSLGPVVDTWMREGKRKDRQKRET